MVAKNWDEALRMNLWAEMPTVGISEGIPLLL